MFKKEMKNSKKLVCNSCNKKCLGEVLRVNEKHFHKQCFLCSVCNKSLSTDGYFIKNNLYFCIADYQKRFGHKCSTCSKYIEGEMVLIMDKSYHVECFNCSNCKQILQDGSRIINVGEELLCENCIVCDEIADIDELENTYDSLVWHPQQSDIEDTTNSGQSNVSSAYQADEKSFCYLNTDQSYLKKIITPYNKTKNLSHFHHPTKFQSSNRGLFTARKNIDPVIKMSRNPDGKNHEIKIEISEPISDAEEILEISPNRTGMVSLLTTNIRKFKQESFDIRTASKYPSGSEEYMTALSSFDYDMDFYDERDNQQSKKLEDESDVSSGKFENSGELSDSFSDSSFYSIPYNMLVTTNTRLPDNVDRCNLERHLSEIEFSEVLMCSRMDFYSMPIWKRDEIKRKALIF